ncbi:CsgG/HfaB family protein [Fodinibius sp.]|uniref:CsgG/HfaB family protein n=1 Tax=Fodinibius sp. TaxID=1872440 RepID=UPI002ACE0775|nr:CsgG/HfaB family protein [Fodinibius sp.]MDZ7659864.1 CsgG/HfaB family protein [Fodinibius sp.]
MHSKAVTICSILLAALLLGSCTSALHPLETERVKPGIQSKVHKELTQMPEPQSKVVAAVYRFRDQTGQYKPSNRGASWSTAVTQGATSILIKSMEDSGWFTPIERAGVSNLLNERQIIQKTRQQNNQSGKLPPMLFAGVILEGGIIGYDTNVITGGGGARLLGTGVSGQYRKDQVTIYLRAVSTKTGKVLETVHTTKSIISQELQSGAFRYIDTNRLLEAEAGFTYNEPPVMAVTEAIDEAVKLLIINGEKQGLWSARDTTAFNQYVNKFEQKKEWEQRAQTNYFGLNSNEKFRSGLDISANVMFGSHIGSYPVANNEIGAALKAEYFLSRQLSLKGNIERSRVGAQKAFSKPYTAFDLTVNGYFTPDSKLSPFVGLGAGNITYDRKPQFSNRGYFPTVTAEAGLDYRISERLGVHIGFNYRYLIEDGLDGISKGTIHDQKWNVSTGISYSPKFLQ